MLRQQADTDELFATREALIRDGCDGLREFEGKRTVLRDEILRSWRRCVSAAIPAGELAPRRVERPTSSDLLGRAAGPILDNLQAELADLGVAVLLSNRSGRIIARRVQDSRQRDRLDDHYVVEDFVYSEGQVGTNGLGTALEERQPVWVRGAEHFNESLSVFTCVGVPITGPRGGLVAGSLSLASAAAAANPMMLSLTKLAARHIESSLRELVFAREHALASAFVRRHRGGGEPSMLLTGDSVLSDTALLPLVTPANHVALWEAMQHLDWAEPAVSFEIDLSGVRTTIDAHRLEDADGPAFMLRFPREGSAAGARGVPPTTPVEETPATELVHPCRTVHTRILEAVATTGTIALHGRAGTGRLHTSTRLAVSDQRDFVVVDLAVEQPHDDAWARTAIDAVRDSQCVVVRHLELLQETTFPVVESMATTATATNGLLVLNLDGEAASPAVRQFVDRIAVRVELPDLVDMRPEFAQIVQSVLQSIDESTPALRPSAAALQCLARWDWPGNIAELRTVLVAAAASCAGRVIHPDDLPGRLADNGATRRLTEMQRAERRAIVKALSECAGNRSRAAEHLGIGRTTLYRKLRELKIGAAADALA